MRSQRGFTLLEVMVALTIIALGLVAALSAVTEGINGAASLRDRSYASWIGQNVIAEIRLAGEFPDVDITTGDVEFAGSRWVWEAEISETGVDRLRRIDVRVMREGEEEFIRETIGFVGEPVVPGLASGAWTPRGNRSEIRE